MISIAPLTEVKLGHRAYHIAASRKLRSNVTITDRSLTVAALIEGDARPRFVALPHGRGSLCAAKSSRPAKQANAQ
jgi:hypothetical protein